MSLTTEALKKKISDTLECTHVAVNDISAGRCGDSFEAVVVSEEFAGKGRLAQHRMVQGALGEELKLIHAFTLKTYTPQKWKEHNSN